MGVTVYGFEIVPGSGNVLGYSTDLQTTLDEARSVRRDIVLEDGEDDLQPTRIYGFDLFRPDLDQLLSALNGDADLKDLILRDRWIAGEVAEIEVTIPD